MKIFQNPCDLPMLRKLFRPKVTVSWNILGKETVDEIIFRTTNVRNRLILELMARGGMRIGEVLKLRFCDIQDRKLIIRDPKSGKEQVVVFIPQKVANRLQDYASQKCISPTDRIFPISYEAARIMVIKAGNMVGIHFRRMVEKSPLDKAQRRGLSVSAVAPCSLIEYNSSCFLLRGQM